MNVAFLIGPKSEKIASSMANSADNIKFFTYSDIRSMIKESTMRHVFFDRIVLSEGVLGNAEEELGALNGYITDYSDNTSVVMVCKSGSSEKIEVFSKFFNSPLYTPVIADKVTVTKLLEFVKGDILAIKADYYTLENKEVKAVTNKYVEEPKKEVSKPVEKPAKKGFFASLFGGKKNEPPKVENQKVVEEPLTTERKAEETVSNFSEEESSSSFTPEVGSSGLGSSDWELPKNEIEGIASSVQEVLGSLGESDSDEGFSPEIGEADDLSIGGFGESHVDTGYLDDEDEQELVNSLGVTNEEVEDEVKDGVIEEPVVEESTSEPLETDKISLMIGMRGLGLTTRIVNKAVSMVEQGLKVLIIDLDYKENGLLSFIDTDNFYNKGCNNGIELKKTYEEDGVSLISNGYGKGISQDSLVGLLESSEVYWKYDCIILDCPLDCMDCLNKDILESSSIFIHVNGNKGSLTSTIKYLTSNELEDTLFERSVVSVDNKIIEYDEDVSSLKKSMLFGRGDWLSKLS